MSTRPLLLALALLTLTGCHARYKKMAPQIGSVRPVVMEPGAPSLQLGEIAVPELDGPALVSDVVDVVVAAGTLTAAPKANARLQRAISPDEVARALEKSLLNAPSAGALPHEIEREGRHLMRVEVVDYGIDVSQGAPHFYTTVSVRIDRKRDGKRVYRATTSCSQPIGSMPEIPVEVVQKIQALQGLAEVSALTPQELRTIALVGVRRCGRQVVERMVRHAG